MHVRCIVCSYIFGLGITVNTSSQTSPAFNSQSPSNSPQQPTSDDLDANITLVGRMSSEVFEIELQTGSCSPVEEILFVQEETNTGASSTILLPHNTAPLRSKDNIVPGME